ncbi:unnamed protein product, partial [Polarella glacialis]
MHPSIQSNRDKNETGYIIERFLEHYTLRGDCCLSLKKDSIHLNFKKNKDLTAVAKPLSSSLRSSDHVLELPECLVCRFCITRIHERLHVGTNFLLPDDISSCVEDVD